MVYGSDKTMKKAILYISRGTEVPKFVKEIYPLIQGEESQLYLLYVLEEESTEKLLGRIGDTGFMGEKTLEALKEILHQEYLKRGQGEMDNLLAQFKENGLSTIGLFKVGRVSEQVLQAATEIGADLIIIGQSKKYRFSKTFPPSELRLIQTHAPCPVKII